MKLPVSLIILTASVLVFCGCSTAQRFEDVSSDPVHSAIVGGHFNLKVPIHISGVNAPPGYEKLIDYYVVHQTSPSWSGPELITRDTLPSGTIFTVESVRQCSNCPFERVIDATIRFSSYATEVSRPVHIKLAYLSTELMEPLPN